MYYIKYFIMSKNFINHSIEHSKATPLNFHLYGPLPSQGSPTLNIIYLSVLFGYL